MDSASLIAILLGIFFLLLLLGTPIAVAMTIASLIPLLLVLPFDVVIFTAAQNVVQGMNKYSLLAIPLFVLSGSIMSESGLARRLIDFAKIFVGWIPGSLLHINVVANMFFGAISGSSVAAASSIGKVLSPIEEEEGYDKGLSAATNIASAPAGFLIPPNNGAIMFATLSNGAASVTSIFLAGYIPGLMLCLGTMIMSYYFSKKLGYTKNTPIHHSEILNVTFRAIPVIFLMVLIVGGITTGLFTPSEASGVAAAYSLILAFAYKAMTLQKLKKIIRDTANATSTILYLIACSYILSWLMSYISLPEQISNGLSMISNNPTVILLLITVVLFILGMFLDVSPITAIFTPIFVPIILKYGINPVHFSIIMTLCSALGVCTPPVGTLLYVGATIGNERIERVLKYLWPMILMLLIVTVLNIFIPELSLFLPRILGAKL